MRPERPRRGSAALNAEEREQKIQDMVDHSRRHDSEESAGKPPESSLSSGTTGDPLTLTVHGTPLGNGMARDSFKDESINTGTDGHYVRREVRNQVSASEDLGGRPLAQDRKRSAKTKVKSGQGDRRDR
jgi:hypothetical protein